MRRQFVWLLFTAVILAAGCTFPEDTPTDPRDTDGNTISSVLENLPDLTLMLPASLSGEPAGASPSGSRIRPRAVGTVKTVTQADFPSVRSDGWVQLKQDTEPDQSITFPLQVLKAYAAGHEIKAGDVFSLGTSTVHVPNIPSTQDWGKAVVAGTADEFEVFWRLNTPLSVVVPGSTGSFPVNLYMNVVRDAEGRHTITVRGLLEFPAMTLYGASVPPSVQIIYTHFNEVSGTSLMGMDSEFSGTSYVKKAWTNSDGSCTAVIAFPGDSPSISIGWGDNEKGGLLYKSDSSIYLEFYNSTGGLLMGKFGSSEESEFRTPETLFGTQYYMYGDSYPMKWGVTPSGIYAGCSVFELETGMVSSQFDLDTDRDTIEDFHLQYDYPSHAYYLDSDRNGVLDQTTDIFLGPQGSCSCLCYNYATGDYSVYAYETMRAPLPEYLSFPYAGSITTVTSTINSLYTQYSDLGLTDTDLDMSSVLEDYPTYFNQLK